MVDQDELMGRNEYARHRGCAQNAVKKAEDDGRIAQAVVREGGVFVGIKWRLADQLWAANTDPVEAARTNRVLTLAPTQPAPFSVPELQPGDATPPLPAGNGDQADYLAARAKREGFQAKQAELEYLQAIGLLVPAGEMREVAYRRYRGLRDKLFNIPERNASVFAAAARAALTNEEAAARLHKLLNDDFRRVLDELSDVARAEAAGGTAERVAA